MKYFANAAQANLAVLLVVSRLLHARGPVDYDTMCSWLRPEGPVSGKDDALQASLSVGLDLNLLRQDATDTDTWHLGSALSDAGQTVFSSGRRFAYVAARALMARASAQREQGEEVVDLALGISWILSSDPARPFAVVPDGGLWSRVDDAGLRDVVANETQWRQLVRWATDLGFCVRMPARGSRGMSERLVADPTGILRTWLDDLAPGRYGAKELLELLSQSFPVLDSGSLATALKERDIPLARAEANAGPSTFKALERLAEQGYLAIRDRDDAPDRDRITVMAWPGDMRRVDLVEVLSRA